MPLQESDTAGKRCVDKQRYPDALAAMLALSHMRHKGRTERRVYRCGVCRGWHATRQPLRMVRPPYPGAPAGLA